MKERATMEVVLIALDLRLHIGGLSIIRVQEVEYGYIQSQQK